MKKRQKKMMKRQKNMKKRQLLPHFRKRRFDNLGVSVTTSRKEMAINRSPRKEMATQFAYLSAVTPSSASLIDAQYLITYCLYIKYTISIVYIVRYYSLMVSTI